MDRRPKNHYDDLTVESDEYDDTLDGFEDPGTEDLFDLSYNQDADSHSSISRLKSLIFSIDWEITNETLGQLTQELNTLKKRWAEERINLVYIQAMEKISRYVYVEKANAHPGALKLLFTLHQNLEEIVSHENWTEEQRKDLLREDVKQFTALKNQIQQGVVVSLAGDEEQCPKEDSIQQVESPAFKVEEVENEGSFAVAEDAQEEQIVEDISDVEASEEIAEEQFAEEEVAVEERPLAPLQLCLREFELRQKESDYDALQHELTLLRNQFYDFPTRQDLLAALDDLSCYVQESDQPHEETFRVIWALFNTLENVISGAITPEEEPAEAFAVLEQYQAVKRSLENDTLQHLSISDVEDYSSGEFATATSQEGEEEPVDPLLELERHSTVLEVEPGGEEDFSVTPEISEEELFDLSEQSRSFVQQIDEKQDITADKKAFSSIPEEMALQGVNVDTEADDDSGEDDLPLHDGELAPALASVTWENVEERKEDLAIEETVSGFFEEIGEPIVEEDVVSAEADGEALAAIGVEDCDEEELEPLSPVALPLEDDLSTEVSELDVVVDEKSTYEFEEDDALVADPKDLQLSVAAEMEEEEELFSHSNLVMESSSEEIDSFAEHFDTIDAGIELKDTGLDGFEEDDTLADAALAMLDEREGEVAELFPEDSLETTREEQQGFVAVTDMCDDEEEDSITFLDSASTTNSREEFSFLEQEHTIDRAVALAGVDTEIDDEEEWESEDSLAVGVVAAVGGVGGVGALAAEASTSEFRANVEESIEDFFGSEAESTFAPAQDSTDSAGDGSVVSALPEDLTELQESVYILRQYCEELAPGERGEKLDTILKQNDALVEKMEGRTLELHLLLLFTAVADYLKRHPENGDAQPVLLLRSLSTTLGEVLEQPGVLTAQKLLLRESARVLEWQGELIA